MKRKSVYDARKDLVTIMRECCQTGNHKPFYAALKGYEPLTAEQRASAVAALLEFCKKQQSPEG